MSTAPPSDARSDALDDRELESLIRRVFEPRDVDRRIALLTDLPARPEEDHPAWRERRALVADWAAALKRLRPRLGLGSSLYLYPRVGQNNADLPELAHRHRRGPLPATAEALSPRAAEPFLNVFLEHGILLAPTEYSTTAPLKLAARRFGFRAATMPGFRPAMIPALKLDYREVDRRVRRLKTLLDRATAAELRFATPAGDATLRLDLRHRTAHASGGLLHQPGSAGNLPSGEAYIVPYEGEHADDPSRSEGRLPVELDGEVVIYRIEQNRARGVETDGPRSRREAELLTREPAYGNLAELGLGVLAAFGVEPIGQVLIDEKLGLHIAFGRSDHFGGQVGAAQFTSPAAVVHIDRVYLPQTQPRVTVRAVDLESDGETRALMRDGDYV